MQEPGADAGEVVHDISAEIGALLPELMPIARSIAPRSLDPEDLLADAVVRLLAKQREEAFHVEHAKAYLATIMRNMVLDFHRSPRSRVEPQEQSFFVEIADEEPTEPSRVRAADLHREYSLVNTAFEALPESQRVLLRELLLRGRAPAEVAREFGIGASAIAVRLFRAKAALRRGLLIEHLSRGGAECRENAGSIVTDVELDPEQHSARQRGMRHVLECETCRGNWSAFAAMAQALGVLPLLVVAVPGRAPAAAAVTAALTGADRMGTGEPAASHAGAPSSQDLSRIDPGQGGASAGGEGAAALGGAGASSGAAGAGAAAGASGAAAMTGAAGGAAAAAAGATAAGGAGAIGVAGGMVVGGMVAATTAAAGFGVWLLRALTSRAMTMVWAGSLAVGGGFAATQVFAGEAVASIMPGERYTLGADEQLDARFSASVMPAGSRALVESAEGGAGDGSGDAAGAGSGAAVVAQLVELRLDFDIADVSGWRVNELVIALPDGATLLRAPLGADCTVTGDSVSCAALGENWAGASFVVELAGHAEDAARPAAQRQFVTWITATSDRDIELQGIAERIFEETSPES